MKSAFSPVSSPPTILLAEDDRELRALIALKLRGAGFEVVEAPDGNSLLEYLADALESDGKLARFDLIVSDIRMPHFTALDVMVGARGCIGNTPVVLITAFGDTVTHERALQLGAAAVIDKPVRLDDLVRTIRSMLPARNSDVELVEERAGS